jgi:phosphoglycerol transferase MdoB-like AlkP superfamily enzyme
LRANDFENIISQGNYPSSEIKTTLGVPDDYMFRYSIPIIDNLHSKNKPFFVTFMTASDHGPYYVPKYFHPHNSDIKHQIAEYADWSLKEFISLSSKEDWFDNTIFIFVADHGVPISAPYDISLDYHHTPLIFYAPKILTEPKTHGRIGGQIDIFPTIMGLLKQPYINNTLGIDLLKEERPFIFVNDDDKIGVLNDALFLIMKDKETAKLYKYKNNDKTNYVKEYPEIVNNMQEYAKANMQVFQYMLLNEQTLMLPNNVYEK